MNPIEYVRVWLAGRHGLVAGLGLVGLAVYQASVDQWASCWHSLCLALAAWGFHELVTADAEEMSAIGEYPTRTNWDRGSD